MPPLKVLVAHNDYQQAGGETAAVEAEVALLRARGHAVVYYARENAEIAHFSAATKAASVPATVYSRKTYRELRELVERERPDVAHVHNVFPLLSPSAYRALSDAGVPIVQGVHNYRFMCPNGLFYTHGGICERCIGGNTIHAVRLRCYRDSYAQSALYAMAVGLHRHAGTFGLIRRFVVPGSFTGEKLVESGIVPAERISVLDYFLPELPAPGSFSERPPHVAFLGRLSDEKGLWTLLAAMRDVPELGLKIFGTGPLNEPIRRYLARECVRNVEMCGFVSGEAKWEALRSALAVVVPSHWYDVSPLTVMESLAAGTPVIAPRHGNFPHTIADSRTGLLFRPQDSSHLRDKLAWLVEEPERALALGGQARRVAESRYNASTHYDRLLEIYGTLA
jgi:glycosyltransferase involved in cell wall biosynthesis